jgi:hypothetical protein
VASTLARLRRGSTDSGADGDGVDELWRRHGRVGEREEARGGRELSCGMEKRGARRPVYRGWEGERETPRKGERHGHRFQVFKVPLMASVQRREK